MAEEKKTKKRFYVYLYNNSMPVTIAGDNIELCGDGSNERFLITKDGSTVAEFMLPAVQGWRSKEEKAEEGK